MIFDNYPLNDLLDTMEAEASKLSADISAAQRRQKFLLALIHYIKNKYGDKR